MRISDWSSDVCSSDLLVARAGNDGYTLLWGTVATHGIGPNIYKKLSYDAVADFEPVVQVVDQPYVLVAHPSKKITSVAGLLKQARDEPGRIPVATAGVGTAAHMLFEKFQADTGTSMLGVPYKGRSEEHTSELQSLM